MDDNPHSMLAISSGSPGVIPSNLPYHVVGIGASAGGIEALLRFFEAMPGDTGMAFVIVLHLSSQHESSLAAVLQARTAMPVVTVTQTVLIEPDHVYVIAPGRDLRMIDDSLQAIPAASDGPQSAIDTFLRSLAEVHRERAVAIILSGAGTDGSVGLSRIKQTGGIAIAQAPGEAKFDTMPKAAIDTGMIDWILPVAEMAGKLAAMAENSARMRHLPASTTGQGAERIASKFADRDSEKALREILTMLKQRTRHDFRHYKRSTILRRIDRRLQVNCLPNMAEYRDYLQRNADEWRALMGDLLIGVTNFFRDREAFDALEQEIVPRLFRHVQRDEPIRAWSVGCATGEEAYSIAMLLDERNAARPDPRPIQVFATDIDEQAIGIARRGLYPQSIEVDVTPARLRQHFDKQDKHYLIRKSIREKLMFAVHNVLSDPPFSRLQLISCRNLLIYLNRDIQTKVFDLFHYALHPSGYLFLGSSEAADAVPEHFIAVDKEHRIYQARPGRSLIGLALPDPVSAPMPSMEHMKAGQHDQRDSASIAARGRMLDDYGMAGLFVDRNGDMLYATNRAGPFLQVPAGEPSSNIFTLIHPALCAELRAALFEARQSGQRISTRPVA